MFHKFLSKASDVGADLVGKVEVAIFILLVFSFEQFFLFEAIKPLFKFFYSRERRRFFRKKWENSLSEEKKNISKNQLYISKMFFTK